MAPPGLPLILALEVSRTRRSPTNPERAAPSHPRDEPRQCAVGRAAHSWRATQARHRGCPVDSGQVHGARPTAAEPELEGLSAQPRGRHRGDGSALVPTICFRLLYVLVILGHHRRRILSFGVTSHPSAEWIAQQITDAFPWTESPRYLIRDRDAIYGQVVTRRLKSMGIRDRPTAPRSPWQNGYVERLIGSIRRECLDHIVVFGEAHFRRILKAYVSYFNEVRTHLSLNKDAPIHRPIQRFGRIISVPVLGGLHHQYCRT